MEKVDEFDLIIFDRYKRRGILPNHYFENIARYVRDGGALLIASGADFAGAESLYRSPLREILPVDADGAGDRGGLPPERLRDRPPPSGHRRRSRSTRRGRPRADGTPGWGRWFRMVEVEPPSGEAVMTGPEGRPLLVLDRQGEGRIAMLGSDQAWLWSRGFEGGGPQLELLRRLAHWLMKEPELEEEVLRGTGEDGAVLIERRTLAESVPPVVATSPSGATSEVTLTEVSPGLWQGRIEEAENGVWRLANGDQQAVAVVGPSAPKEFENPVSTGDVLAPLADRHPRRRPPARGRPARRPPGARGPGRRGPRLDRPRRPRRLPAPRHPPGRPRAGLAEPDPRRRPRLRRLADRGALTLRRLGISRFRASGSAATGGAPHADARARCRDPGPQVRDRAAAAGGARARRGDPRPLRAARLRVRRLHRLPLPAARGGAAVLDRGGGGGPQGLPRRAGAGGAARRRDQPRRRRAADRRLRAARGGAADQGARGRSRRTGSSGSRPDGRTSASRPRSSTRTSSMRPTRRASSPARSPATSR